MKTLKVNAARLGLVFALALASLLVAMPAGAAGGNAIVVHAQDINTGQVMVDSVTAAQDGWLLIWKDASGTPGSLIGYAPVHQGTNANIAVDIRTLDREGNDNLTPTLWATLAADPSALTPYATPYAGITAASSVLMVAFGSTAAQGAAPAMAAAVALPTTGGASSAPSLPKQNMISVRRQDANVGQVVIDSVAATQDGWLLIWRDANGAPNGLIGYAPVHQGINKGVSVDIKTMFRNGNDDLTPTLWATFTPDPFATTPFAVPDSTLTPDTSVLAVAFGSTAN